MSTKIINLNFRTYKKVLSCFWRSIPFRPTTKEYQAYLGLIFNYYDVKQEPIIKEFNYKSWKLAINIDEIGIDAYKCIWMALIPTKLPYGYITIHKNINALNTDYIFKVSLLFALLDDEINVINVAYTKNYRFFNFQIHRDQCAYYINIWKLIFQFNDFSRHIKAKLNDYNIIHAKNLPIELQNEINQYERWERIIENKQLENFYRSQKIANEIYKINYATILVSENQRYLLNRNLWIHDYDFTKKINILNEYIGDPQWNIEINEKINSPLLIMPIR